MPFEEFRLIAIFDFIALSNDKSIMIGDWKTTTHNPKREIYMQSIQSHLYPYLAFQTREHIFPRTGLFRKNDFRMEYWFPAFPELAIAIEYSDARHDTSQTLLSSLISEIAGKEPGTFEKTINDKRCAFCQYRSLCEKGIQAGILENTEIETDNFSALENIDFDLIEEIAF